VRFEFATAGRIVFGPGAVAELPAAARGLGTRALVVTGRD
jgi:alcohol dehydrogenase class IV